MYRDTVIQVIFRFVGTLSKPQQGSLLAVLSIVRHWNILPAAYFTASPASLLMSDLLSQAYWGAKARFSDGVSIAPTVKLTPFRISASRNEADTSIRGSLVPQN
jgi:hypothetical protein